MFMECPAGCSWNGWPDDVECAFCEHFDAWKGRVRPTMRQTHVGGEKVFVDFAGDTIDVIDPGTGEARAAKLFVAAMGASNFTYAEAVASEGLEDWIGAHVRMLEVVPISRTVWRLCYA